jgi:hypothetical protein
VDAGGDALTATLPAPSVATGTGTATSQTVATITATVTPNDALLTGCQFNYGTSAGYGSSVPCTSVPSPTGGAQTVTAQITGLTASTTYHFQIAAANASGTSAGADAQVTTPAPLKPAPAISGTPAVGQTLTCTLGVTLPAGLTASYVWDRDNTPIAGAVAGTYLVAVADETHYLTCHVTISGDGGTAMGGTGYVAIPADTIGTVTESSVAKASVNGHSVTTMVTCTPQAVTQCTIALRLTHREGHRTITVGSSSATVAPGASAKLTVSLNAAGSHLLASGHALATTLVVSGTVVGVIKGTIRKQSVTLIAGKAHHARRRSA